MRDLQARHGAALLAYVRHLAGNHHDAEDIVQETLIRAWRNADTLDLGGDAVRGWLFTVARRILIDRVRVRSAVPAGIDFQTSAQAAAGDVETEVVNRVHVLEALARLSEEQRTVLIEVHYRGRSVDSVARSLGIPPGTVRSRAFYGLRNLRALFEAERAGQPPADGEADGGRSGGTGRRRKGAGP